MAAIGNPLGEELRGTMTDGIISAINRDVNVDGYTMVLLQTTAASTRATPAGRSSTTGDRWLALPT